MFCTAAMVTLVVTETVAQGDAFVVTRRLSWGHALLQQTESTCNTIVPGVYRTKIQVINQEWYRNLFRGTVGKDPFTLSLRLCLRLPMHLWQMDFYGLFTFCDGNKQTEQLQIQTLTLSVKDLNPCAILSNVQIPHTLKKPWMLLDFMLLYMLRDIFIARFCKKN